MRTICMPRLLLKLAGPGLGGRLAQAPRAWHAAAITKDGMRFMAGAGERFAAVDEWGQP